MIGHWPTTHCSDWLGTESDFEPVYKPLASGFGPVEWTGGLAHLTEHNRLLHTYSSNTVKWRPFEWVLITNTTI
jgi:hypothetical protein